MLTQNALNELLSGTNMLDHIHRASLLINLFIIFIQEPT